MTRKNQRLDFLAAISGVMIALQARANGELSHLIGNGVQAALVSFGSGLLIIAIVAIFSRSIKEGARNLRGAVARQELPRWTLFAGALGGSFVAVQTHIVPLIGVALKWGSSPPFQGEVFAASTCRLLSDAISWIIQSSNAAVPRLL